MRHSLVIHKFYAVHLGLFRWRIQRGKKTDELGKKGLQARSRKAGEEGRADGNVSCGGVIAVVWALSPETSDKDAAAKKAMEGGRGW